MSVWLGNIGRGGDESQLQRVIEGGYCVGCGVCALVDPDAISMQVRNGAYSAVIEQPSAHTGKLDQVCPFSDAAPDEDSHSRELFRDAPAQSRFLGAYRAIYAGHVADVADRGGSSSGGITTWLLQEALKTGLVDAVVHVAPSHTSAELFHYTVSTTVEEVRAGAKTRYFSVTLADALQRAAQESQRVILVGVPCFIKAVRNLSRVDSQVKESVLFTVSLICGHMKSQHFADSLAWQLGVKPEEVSTVDFRVKIPERHASDYGFSVTRASNSERRTRPMQELEGRRWDVGYFKLKACEFCDDVVGETADISVGDAWLPQYTPDAAGTNVIIVRNQRLAELLEAGKSRGAILLDDLSQEEAVRSQAGGFRDRREGLAYRLWLKDRRGAWRPRKRVNPEREHLTRMRRLTFRSRMLARKLSFIFYGAARTTRILRIYTLPMMAVHAWFRLVGIVDERLRRSARE